jgi:hypothetical protein
LGWLLEPENLMALEQKMVKARQSGPAPGTKKDQLVRERQLMQGLDLSREAHL